MLKKKKKGTTSGEVNSWVKKKKKDKNQVNGTWGG